MTLVADPLTSLVHVFARTHGAAVPADAPLPQVWAALAGTGLGRPGRECGTWAAGRAVGGAFLPLVASSRDVGALLDRLVRAHPRLGGECLTAHRTQDGVVVTLRAPDGGAADPDTVDACFGLLLAVLDRVGGGRLPQGPVLLRRDGADEDALVVGPDVIDRPVRADAGRPASRRTAELSTPWALAVTAALAASLEAGGGLPSLDALATGFAVSRRTLQQRLTGERTTFAALADAVRREVALDLLASGLPVSDVARRAGFADPVALGRAVRRWTGLSPTAWRDGAGRPPAAPGPPTA